MMGFIDNSYILNNWFNQMINTEIEQIKISIENEKLWLKGSTSKDDILQHEENIENLEDYLQMLEESKREE